ncbi:hypothetical protein [Sutcliffiella cohnii]|uniref:hypothetical protein n=1 Tax=Sutcliffiella cohnii TaxID=33932 RepID=UPI002E1AA2C5|nr:hypothetical protein [Sutcliffiella cohnii]
MKFTFIIDKLIVEYKKALEEYREIVGENEENVLDYEAAMKFNQVIGLLEAYRKIRNFIFEQSEEYITLDGIHKECESYGVCFVRCTATYQEDEYALIFELDGRLSPLIELYDREIEDYVEIDECDINGDFRAIAETAFKAHYFENIEGKRI